MATLTIECKLKLNCKLILTETSTPVITNTILAGTSPGGLILKSINNGVSFTNEGTAGKGNPLAFCKLLNGDLLYTTDLGWVVNYTQSTSVKVSEYAIRAIYENGDIENISIDLGDVNGEYYLGNFIDGFNIVASGYGVINQIYDKAAPNIQLLFTSTGIYDLLSSATQLGNFTCACFDEPNGFIYAGTNDGHIWKNTVANVFSAWTDLGNKLYYKVSFIQLIDDGYFVFNQSIVGSFLIYKPDFTYANGTSLGNDVGHLISICNIPGFGFALGDDTGRIVIVEAPLGSSIYTFTGQQYSQTSINCLISIEN